jgi:hypothetical protein
MKHLFKALSDFQQEVPVIHKDTQGFGYTYADLPRIFTIINPLLKKHGLGFTQPIIGSVIQTIVFHVESGESISSEIKIQEGVVLKGMNEFQVLGSGITYLRRYALSSILGIVTDKDTDAAGEQVKPAVASVNASDDKPWLNESDSEAWGKVIASLKNGYTLTDVRKKYKISKPVETKLLSQSQSIPS